MKDLNYQLMTLCKEIRDGSYSTEVPLAGGPAAKALHDKQRALDRGARQTISRELGHDRISISAVYLGS
jgi:hypothetical protein